MSTFPWRHWLNRTFRGRRRVPQPRLRQRRLNFALWLERLEDRTQPAASHSATRTAALL
jgi:hypothetical protein